MQYRHPQIKISSIKGFEVVSQVFKEGKSFKSKNFVVVLSKLYDANNQIEFAVIASKKRNKKAVTRNRIKRLLRQSLNNYLKAKQEINSYRILLIANTSIDMPSKVNLQIFEEEIYPLLDKSFGLISK
jgi:ribonuclease P protein component